MSKAQEIKKELDLYLWAHSPPDWKTTTRLHKGVVYIKVVVPTTSKDDCITYLEVNKAISIKHLKSSTISMSSMGAITINEIKKNIKDAQENGQ